MTQTADFAVSVKASIWDRLGLPRSLALGYLGLLFFMIGDGVESNYIAPFLRDNNGLDTSRVAALVSLYGIVVAIAAWLSAALSDLWGPRRVMAIGFVAWVTFEVVFLTAGVAGNNETVMFISYALRGVGYPLFAFGFLVWIAAVANRRRLATAIGWFYVMFTAGLPTLGALVANGSIPLIGEYNTLWLSMGMVIVGGLIALLGVKEPTGRSRLAVGDEPPFTVLATGLKLIATRPRVLSAAVIRMINTAPQYGSFVFFPALFAEQFGFGLAKWLLLTTIIYAANIPFNVVFGMVGDRLGWVQTVRWFGAVGSGASLLALYYLPAWTGSYGLAVLAGMAFGISLAGFVPLSAITASLEPSHPGAVMSAYNIGMGASVAVGPIIVTLFIDRVGEAGVIWIFVGMYAFAAILTTIFDRRTGQSTAEADPVAEAQAARLH
ncbi:MFS transporter [Mycobacterium sp. Y57]|uniref:MFS transporter n=1 Tax=Mycolicibacterium xanthum TaxID=2796469 RepID=UPI001C85F599|nr:MFS transporter [Mycolicibacterium xanthum]MBX7431136.1 MFS transporter [Mycolicibacterium xanthum]